MADGNGYKDEGWLREQYCQKGRRARKIAEECGVHRTTIYNWLERHGIERDRGIGYRVDEPEKYRDADWLREQYLAHGLSTSEIAELCNCTKETIRRWLDRHGIPTRDNSEAIKLSWEGAEERREEVRKQRLEEGSSTKFYDTSEWKRVRATVLERDGYTCQWCGSESPRLHAHHKTLVSEGGDEFDLENITTLCADCHAEEHPNRPLLRHV